jgi:hypothetical protein
MAASSDQTKRAAHLKLTSGADGHVLTASVPGDVTEGDFNHLGRSILGLIKRQTGCNCLSGRIKVVLQEDFSEVVRVDLGPAKGG